MFELCCVIGGALCAQFLGFVGFFILTWISGILSAICLMFYIPVFWVNNQIIELTFGELFFFTNLTGSITLYIDNISFSFSLLTALIGAFVYGYAFSYMRFERNILNFLIYLQLFKLSMILLVWAGSWFVLLLGWELIGVTSFLLINYWTSKITTLRSAFKAFTFNKISDAALILSCVLCLWHGSILLQSTTYLTQIFSFKKIYLLGIMFSFNDVLISFLIIAAFCKSAQFGFHFWLPDSMEAPVPASALIHSATLVSAGIYLMLRFTNCLHESLILLPIYLFITSFTAMFGAIIASMQTDVKKILAYSTISHCGFLLYSIALNIPHITIFYLFAHGFFKSLNFICVGNFIQYANNYQDVARMGRFGSFYSLEFFYFLITSFNLSSTPLFFAFFSKHWIVLNINTFTWIWNICTVFIFIAAFCGFLYSVRLTYECLLAIKRSHYTSYNIKNITKKYIHLNKANWLSLSALTSLFLMSFFILWILYIYTIDLTLINLIYTNTYLPILLTTQINLWFGISILSINYTYLNFKISYNSHILIIMTLILSAIIFNLW